MIFSFFVCSDENVNTPYNTPDKVSQLNLPTTPLMSMKA